MTMTTNTIPTFKELVEFIKDVPNIDHEAVSLVRKAEKKSNIAQFGVLEELAEWLSGWQGSYPPRADNIVMSIFVSNHGISDNYEISKYSKSNLAWIYLNKPECECLENNKRFMKDLKRYYRDLNDLIKDLNG